MEKGVGYSILLAILFLLPVCANATTIDFYNDGTIVDGNYFDQVNIWNDATVDMTGGYVASCDTFDTSVLNYLDGGIQWGVTHENSILNVYSGYDTDFQLENCSKVFLHNGSLNFQVSFTSGSDNAILHIYGYDLNYTPSVIGSIDGYWESNQVFNFNIMVRHSADVTPTIILHEIPEPSTFCILGLLALFMRKRGDAFLQRTNKL